MNKNLLDSNLNKILSALNALHALLNTEKQLLSESDFEKITSIAEQKKQLITSIEVNDAEFKSMINSITAIESGKSIHDIIVKHFPACSDLWSDIEQLLKSCKKKNSINGIILSNNHRQTKDSLAILQGQTNEVLIYGASGESIASKSSFNTPLSV